MLRNPIRKLAILVVLLAFPSFVRAGANTWTGGRAANTLEGAPALVSSSAMDPNVVYAAFGPVLHRSTDGGRTWARVREFQEIHALLVHPASPLTIFVSATADNESALYVSRDGGDTWARTMQDGMPRALAASPTNPAVMFAGQYGAISRSTDGGLTWQKTADVAGVVASLVIHPREESVAYAASEGFEYFGDYPGSLGKSIDGGATWKETGPQPLDSAYAVGVDPVDEATVYVAIGPYTLGPGRHLRPDVQRSSDGGVTWVSAGAGLPGAVIRQLVVDPRVSGTVYVGTDAGVYRTRDRGEHWSPFGQQLAGTTVTSLSIARDGRRMFAGTTEGIYELELASGPLDVAEAGSGASRVLSVNGDQMSVGELDATGAWTGGARREAPGWAAVAIADAGEGHHRVLWQNGDGRATLELLGPSGREAKFPLAVQGFPGWMPRDISVGGDGRTHVLWTQLDGRMFVAAVNASGVSTAAPTYGPWGGWSAIAIADASSGDSWVLWRSTDGRAALSVHRDGAMTSAVRLGAYLDWSAEDLAIGADGRPRLLRTSPSGLASVVTIDERGLPVAGARYTLPGFTPRRIAAGADGVTRLLLSSDDGQGELLLLDANNQLSSKKALRPLADVVVTNSAELEAAMTPANSGKQILVRAGEYSVSHALTVPDGATVVGEGEMLFDGSGLPSGMAAAGRTALSATADLDGDVLTLGNGSSLRGLVIEDADGRSTGNPVAVLSRSPGDFVSARIEACEILNPNPSGVAPSGPTGRAFVVVNRNPNLAFDPPAHVGAALDVRMTNSILRSPAGSIGVFAINFASQATIDLDLSGNVIGGGLTAAGGVSRPEAVTGASIRVKSRRNLYRSDSADPTPFGWNLSGGSTAPVPNIVSEASTSNSLQVHSTDDRIEGFSSAISASGGQRLVATSQPISSNSLDLNLQGTRLQSSDADLFLFGGFSLAPGVAPGDGNVLRLNMRQATGSGPRGNVYANSSEDLGADNRLVVVGSPTAFEQTNTGIDPRPPDQFFTAPQ